MPQTRRCRDGGGRIGIMEIKPGLTARALCGIGAFIFFMLLITHIFGRLDPAGVGALLLMGALVCAFWWWELGRT